jgi:hypothetical protein
MQKSVSIVESSKFAKQKQQPGMHKALSSNSSTAKRKTGQGKTQKNIHISWFHVNSAWLILSIQQM